MLRAIHEPFFCHSLPVAWYQQAPLWGHCCCKDACSCTAVPCSRLPKSACITTGLLCGTQPCSMSMGTTPPCKPYLQWSTSYFSAQELARRMAKRQPLQRHYYEVCVRRLGSNAASIVHICVCVHVVRVPFRVHPRQGQTPPCRHLGMCKSAIRFVRAVGHACVSLDRVRTCISCM